MHPPKFKIYAIASNQPNSIYKNILYYLKSAKYKIYQFWRSTFCFRFVELPFDTIDAVTDQIRFDEEFPEWPLCSLELDCRDVSQASHVHLEVLLIFDIRFGTPCLLLVQSCPEWLLFDCVGRCVEFKIFVFFAEWNIAT